MNSPTITMERDAALATLKRYEAAAKANPKAMRDMDRGIMQGYRVLARGGRLVDVNEAIRHAGPNLAGIPKLAIARASAKRSRWVPQGRVYNSSSRYSKRSMDTGGPTGGGLYVYGNVRGWDDAPITSADTSIWAVPGGTLEGVQRRSDRGTFYAMTPLIPLPHRPKYALSNYFLLWEANWHPAPPIDPYLLRPVTGSLMEIIAEWDVSPVELAAVRIAMKDRR